MYVLTIVLLASKLTLTSVHASQEACEQAAKQARAMTDGAQAVQSARCEPLDPRKPAPN